MVSALPGKRQKTIKNKFGCEMIPVTTPQAVEAHQKVDSQLAEELAERLFFDERRGRLWRTIRGRD
ncbi:MAG: hypothetical protein NTY19_48795 [Planctomycetota bacterium]|nr:hypothetical protein [Planctomycetota bacterium]